MKMTRILLVALLLIGGVLSMTGVSNALDPNLNTQGFNQRAEDGVGFNPGYDPCKGGTQTLGGVCVGAPNTSLLSHLNVGATDGNNPDTVGMFSLTGAGAVTDNMFAFVEHPAVPTTCAGPGGGGTNVLTNRLNCGFASGPADQLQVIPVNAPLANNLDGSGTTQIMNFGSSVVSGGFNLAETNNFTWVQNTSTTATIASGTATTVAGLVGAGIGQSTVQNTPVGPGSDSFTLLSAFQRGPYANTGQGNVGQAGFNIVWSNDISSPDMGGAGAGAGFFQHDAGVFAHDAGANGFLPITYPTGQLQTQQNAFDKDGITTFRP